MLLWVALFELGGSAPAAEAAVGALQSIWGNLYKELAKADVLGEHVLQTTATLFYSPPHRGRPQEKEDSLELLRANCQTPPMAETISLRLVAVARLLTSLQLQTQQKVVGRILHARMLYVALHLATGVSEIERSKLLQQWERVTFRIFGLLQRDSRTGIGDYVKLGARIVQGDPESQTFNQIMASLRSIGEPYTMDSAVHDGLLRRDLYSAAPEVVRYFLWMYEEFLAQAAGGGATVDGLERSMIWETKAEDSIEHIFPQTPGIGWYGKLYPGRGATDEEVQLAVHRIGNLVLLPKQANTAAGARPFIEKQRLYENHKLRMLDEIIVLDDWTTATIESRESILTDFARRRWSDI